MKNKWKVIGVVVFVSTITVNSMHAQNSMIVRLHDGSQTGTFISTIDKITFSGDTMVVKNKDQSTSIVLYPDIDHLTFGMYSGVTKVTANLNTMAVYPNPASRYILLLQPPEGELNIIIYGLDGIELIHKKLINSMQQIDINDLAKGLYILKVNNNTCKFPKQ